MKRTILLSLLIFFIISKNSYCQSKTGYQLIFNDEFNSTSFDDNKWFRENYYHGTELQCYVDNKEHIPTTPNYKYGVVSGATTLTLVANKEQPPMSMHGSLTTNLNSCKYDIDCDGNIECAQDYNYTSAWFESKQLFQYGYFEIRCKLPAVYKIWPAFWLYSQDGNNWYNEIDIFETGSNKNKVTNNVHWHIYKANGEMGLSGNYDYEILSNSIDDNYHIYGLEWTPDEIVWYIDNAEVRRFPCNNFTPNHPSKLITNLAIDNFLDQNKNCLPPPYWSSAEMAIDYIRVYKKRWTNTYGYNAGGWRTNQHRRLLGDVNGDGKDDIVAIGASSVFVSLAYEDADGPGFRYRVSVLDDFCSSDGYSISNHVVTLADVNGDGAKDLVGFGEQGVKVALAVKVADYQPPRFTTPKLYISDFGSNQGWNSANHRRMLADVNGDGKDDIVCFGASSVLVSLAKVDGNGFGFRWPTGVLEDFCSSDGYSISNHVVALADVNGDGAKDIVGFGEQGVKVALGLKVADYQPPGFTTPKLYVSDFGSNQGWNSTNHRRVLADVNGDGKDDIVCFGASSVLVALAKVDGNGFGFRWPSGVLEDYCHTDDWDINNHPIYLTDINGDGKADIVGFHNAGVKVSISTSGANTPSFKDTYYWRNYFGNNAASGGFSEVYSPRTIADINGDNKSDIVAFGEYGVLASLSSKVFRDLDNIEEIEQTSLKSTEAIMSGGMESQVENKPEIPSIFPNPTDGLINIEVGKFTNSIVEVYNSQGELLFFESIENNGGIDLSSYKTGVYILKINNDNGEYQTITILKR